MKFSLLIVCAIIAIVSALIANSSIAAEKIPAADNFVFWPADEIPAGYRHMRDIFSTDVVRRGARETSLPPGPTLEIRYQYGGVVKSTDDFVRENRVGGLLILNHGKIVLERYGLNQQPSDYWTSNSVAKSFISTLVGAAIHDGAIGSVNDRMSKYIPELAAGSFADVTVRDVLLMASGVGWNENYEDRDADSTKIRNLDFPGSTAPPLDIVDYMSHRPKVASPGRQFHYNSGNSHLLGVLLQRATGKSLSEYLSEKIWIPAGMEADASVIRDRFGRAMGSCCLNARLRDFGRFGLYFMNGAKDQSGQSLLPEGWMAEATAPTLPTEYPGFSYGYQWWIENDSVFSAIGIFGQMIWISPKDGLVVVQLSAWEKAEWSEGYAHQAAFIAGVTQAVRAYVVESHSEQVTEH